MRRNKSHCIFCNKETDFLLNNGFCQCREVSIKQKYIKRKKKPPFEDIEAFMRFARQSYSGSVGLAIDPNRKTKKRKRRQFAGNSALSASEFYKSRNWLELRYQVLKEGGFRCVACGATSMDSVLHVDHIKPRSLYPALELDKSNLQVLCEKCNLGKSNY